jgi:hypothetical protein
VFAQDKDLNLLGCRRISIQELVFAQDKDLNLLGLSQNFNLSAATTPPQRSIGRLKTSRRCAQLEEQQRTDQQPQSSAWAKQFIKRKVSLFFPTSASD